MKQQYMQRWGIPLLMLTSGLLLSAFLLKWLMTQYDNAGKTLQKDVHTDVRKTGDQLVDSVIVDFFSLAQNEPVKASATIAIPDAEVLRLPATHTKTEIKIIVNNDSSARTKLYREMQSRIPRSHTRIRTLSNDSSRQIVHLKHGDNPLEDSVLMQLFTEGAGVVARQLSSYNASGDILTLTRKPFNKHLCRKVLRKNWQHAHLRYEVVFAAPGKQVLAKKEGVIYPDNPLLGNQFGVRLTNAGSVALVAILPEMLFAFLLVVITVVAFVLVYRSYLKQVQINALRTDFVNNISHELKTPVSTVRVALDALQHYRKDDPQVREEYLQLMSQEVNRLDRLIHQVLQHGRLESTENLLQLLPTDFAALVEEVVCIYQRTGARIHFKHSEEPVLLQLDAEHIRGVVVNLLENALHYAGEQPEISVVVQRTGNRVVLEVSDNGPGIPSEYLPQLFRPFFRVPKGNTHNVKGYGLGLSYCKQIVEQHGGRISVENRTSGGCTFRVELKA